jgi:hypothetical protein
MRHVARLRGMRNECQPANVNRRDYSGALGKDWKIALKFIFQKWVLKA